MNCRPNLRQLILKRCCVLRGEMRTFLTRLPNEKLDETASDFYMFLADCVDNIDEAEKVWPDSVF